MAGPLLAGTFPGVAAATTGCDIQTAKEGIDGTIDSNGDFILRAGTGFGSHGLGGQGMWLGDADPISCIRVSSIYSVHDNSNFEEMGAAIIAPGSSPFCDQPSDGHWQRFWFEVVANSKFCSSRSQDVQETQNTFYNVALFRDAQQTTNWHLHFGGNDWVYLLGPTVSSGYPIGGTERWNTTDSMYGNFDGAQFMRGGGNWDEWASVSAQPPFHFTQDSQYLINVIQNDPKQYLVCKPC